MSKYGLRMSEDEYKRIVARQVKQSEAPAIKPEKPSKYRNVRVELDGHAFDSKREAQHYTVLKLREKAREIYDLRVHTRWPLHALGSAELIGHMESDFDYLDTSGKPRVEDVKGYDNALSKWKRKHFAAQYGTEVEIIK